MKVYRNLRVVLRVVRLAKKIASAFAGIALSVILYLGLKTLLLEYIIKASNGYQHTSHTVICFAIMPFAIFFGSCLTGVLIARTTRRLIAETFIFSPGLWITVSVTVFIAASLPHLIGEALVVGGFLMAVSWAATLVGVAIRKL